MKRHTAGFSSLTPASVAAALHDDPLALVVLRTILGFTPPEWADVATEELRTPVTQGFARGLDLRARRRAVRFADEPARNDQRVQALVLVACDLLKRGASNVPDELIHRMDKADTRAGADGVRHLAEEGVPYAVLLYERLLGRPFASHRDAVSELVGEVMESAVEQQLREAGITYRKTKRAERVPGFDQAPDFIVPDEFSPAVVIEAKITNDDGTARDKVTRVQHLATLGHQRVLRGEPAFEVVACIDGRGFGVRREDMRKLLEATAGKVFTTRTLGHLVSATRLHAFASRPDLPTPPHA